MDQQLSSIIEQFIDDEIVATAPIEEGLINRSYLVETKRSKFILQRINKEIFENAQEIMENIEVVNLVLEHVDAYCAPQIVKTKKGELLYKDHEGFSWRMMLFIPNSKTFNTTEDHSVAEEAGAIIGEFHAATANIEASQLHTILPNFHDLNFRSDLFLGSLQNASKERLSRAAAYIPVAEELIGELSSLYELSLPLRVTHNDTKLNNILFDSVSGKALCLIDLDTLMPGNSHHDFGDAVRTLCCSVPESETDLSSMEFNWDLFKAFSTGYFNKMAGQLKMDEWQAFALSVELMPFIMGLRFLTDYLYGDVYYKVAYSEQNLDRCKNQFALVEKIVRKRDAIAEFILSFKQN